MLSKGSMLKQSGERKSHTSSKTLALRSDHQQVYLLLTGLGHLIARVAHLYKLIYTQCIMNAHHQLCLQCKVMG